jgi:predicted PurR-regulated permease PerM
MDTKGINDFEEDVDALINDITSKESQTQNTISNLLDNVDGTFQDAENKIDTTIEEINNKTNLIEQNVKENLDSAIISLDKSKKRFDNNFSWYQNKFENSLTGLLIQLFLVVLLYDFIVSWVYQYLGSIWSIIKVQLFGFSVFESFFVSDPNLREKFKSGNEYSIGYDI